MKKEISGSVNLLNTVEPPQDNFTILYDWAFSIGKILLILVQVVVVVVFASRLYLDKVNNDLSRSINDKVEFLSSPEVQEEEEKYRRLHSLFGDISKLDTEQSRNSLLIGGILDSIPSNLKTKEFLFNQYSVKNFFVASNFEDLRQYENYLKQNPKNTDVRVILEKRGDVDSDIEVEINYDIIEE